MTDISDNDLQRLLAGELDDKEYESIIKSLDCEDGRRAMSEQMDIVFNRLENEDIANLHTEQRADVLARIETRIKRSVWKRRISYAASLAAMFVLGWMCTGGFKSLMPQSDDEYNEIVVHKGERPVHMLFQDGTHVIVNSGSTLRYPLCFANNQRRVDLVGEAYFNVKSNPSKPFIVNMGSSEIIVTGTAFNARRFDGDSLTIVTLDDGSLNLCCEDEEFKLKPSQKVVYNHLTKEGAVSTTGLTAARSSLWKDNIIAFDRTPMKEVLSTINRIYDVEFDICDTDVCANRFTFTSAYVPLDSLLKDIAAISFIQFRHNGDRIEVYSTRL